MRRRIPLTFCLCAASALAAPVSLQTFIAQPQPAPDATISYGPTPVQRIDLYLPRTKGPHPVAILIHGGCWMQGDRRPRAAPRRWAASWRSAASRCGASAIAASTRTAAPIPASSRTSPRRSTCCPPTRRNTSSTPPASSPSATRQARTWRSGRPAAASCRATSPAYVPNPFPVRTVIGLGGVGDIERATGLAGVCGPTIVPALLGQPSAARPDVYSDTSPSKLLPNGAKIVMITGAEDTITPPAYAQTYVDEVKAAGGTAELVIVPDAAHFDVVTLGTPAWQAGERADRRRPQKIASMSQGRTRVSKRPVLKFRHCTFIVQAFGIRHWGRPHCPRSSGLLCQSPAFTQRT